MLVHQVAQWLSDSAHWHGPEGVPARVVQHVGISATAVVLSILIALPIGMYIGHARRFELLAVSVANLGRAIPSFAILSIVFQLVLRIGPRFAFGFLPTVVALVLLGVPPILTNAYVGIQQVDADLVEAAKGMGLTSMQVLFRVELPLAGSLIVAGIRIAALQIVATATLAALIAGGGLGRFIVDGFAQFDTPMVVAGAILVAALAIVVDALFGLVERVARPRTMS